jgi:hypothetical protein
MRYNQTTNHQIPSRNTPLLHSAEPPLVAAADRFGKPQLDGFAVSGTSPPETTCTPLRAALGERP